MKFTTGECTIPALRVLNLQMVSANHGIPRPLEGAGDAVIRGFRHLQVEYSSRPPEGAGMA
jgi:hypothetical protein